MILRHPVPFCNSTIPLTLTDSHEFRARDWCQFVKLWSGQLAGDTDRTATGDSSTDWPISDRGTHFTAKVFGQLAGSEEFILVLIARHRPQSDGIAERFVRTLKEWLRDKTWANDEELAALIEQFMAEYNDRPHQGLPIPGLSPNDFANRIWLR